MRIPSGVVDQYICNKCKISKPVGCFGIDRKQARGIKYTCKECINAARRNKYHAENRRYHLKSKYGLTVEEYNNLCLQQKDLCVICNQSEKLYVDHDHVSNEIRGLLCHKCNVAIGLLYDDPIRMEKAAKYIRGYPCV